MVSVTQSKFAFPVVHYTQEICLVYIDGDYAKINKTVKKIGHESIHLVHVLLSPLT